MRPFVVSLALLSSPALALEPIDARPVEAPIAWGTTGVLRSTEPLGDHGIALLGFTTYRAVPSSGDAGDRSMWLGELGGAFGLTPRLTLGLTAPLLFRGYGVYGAPLSALGDARLVLAHTLVAPGIVGPGLAWAIGARAPTGDRASGIAYAAPTATASVHGEYRAAIVELLGHAGIAVPIGEATSIAGVVPEAPHVVVDAVFLHASERFFADADEDVAVVVSLGGAISGPREVFGTVGLRYTPRTHDRDGDGVPDRIDQCPELEEDRDGFEDGDGCPEVDNDNDDVGDEEDKCPNDAGPPETEGCPAPKSDPDSREDR